MPRNLPEPAPKAPPSTAALAAQLRDWRLKGVRSSAEVIDAGEAILKARNGLRGLGDDAWPFLEQLAVAALDCGNLALAHICVDRLNDRFPDSPRVNRLKGMLLEGEGEFDKARAHYEAALAADDTNVAMRKRLISLHLHHSSPPSSSTAVAKGSASTSTGALSLQRGVELLVEYLDTVYNDVEAWQQLADVYASQGLYAQSLACLSDLQLLQPQSPFFALQHAETAYTLADYPLAYRSFLRAMELSGPLDAEPKGRGDRGGLGRRAAIGVKLCLAKLNEAPEASSVPLPEHVDAIDALITDKLLGCYSSEWEPSGPRVAPHAEAKALSAWLSQLGGSGR